MSNVCYINKTRFFIVFVIFALILSPVSVYAADPIVVDRESSTMPFASTSITGTLVEGAGTKTFSSTVSYYDLTKVKKLKVSFTGVVYGWGGPNDVSMDWYDANNKKIPQLSWSTNPKNASGYAANKENTVSGTRSLNGVGEAYDLSKCKCTVSITGAMGLDGNGTSSIGRNSLSFFVKFYATEVLQFPYFSGFEPRSDLTAVFDLFGDR